MNKLDVTQAALKIYERKWVFSKFYKNIMTTNAWLHVNHMTILKIIFVILKS